MQIQDGNVTERQLKFAGSIVAKRALKKRCASGKKAPNFLRGSPDLLDAHSPCLNRAIALAAWQHTRTLHLFCGANRIHRLQVSFFHADPRLPVAPTDVVPAYLQHLQAHVDSVAKGIDS